MNQSNYQSPDNSAKFAFFYMLSLVALVFLTLASGMVVFQIINKTIIDVLGAEGFSGSQLKFAISAMIVAAPVYYVTTYQIHKNLYAGNLHKDSGIRRWLTYVILFIASVVMLGWFMVVVNSFLDGELTTKFVLKAVTAIVLAAVVFTFYFYDIRREEVAGRHSRVVKAYFISSLVLVLAVFASALFFVESPQETRDRKLDNQVLGSFSVIDNAINNYYQDTGQLPPDLAELRSQEASVIRDNLKHPVSGQAYEYKITGDKSYELCAEFRTSNLDENEFRRYEYYRDRWPHDKGYQCLAQTVKQDKNPSTKAPVPAPVD